MELESQRLLFQWILVHEEEQIHGEKEKTEEENMEKKKKRKRTPAPDRAQSELRCSCSILHLFVHSIAEDQIVHPVAEDQIIHQHQIAHPNHSVLLPSSPTRSSSTALRSSGFVFL